MRPDDLIVGPYVMEGAVDDTPVLSRRDPTRPGGQAIVDNEDVRAILARFTWGASRRAVVSSFAPHERASVAATCSQITARSASARAS